MFGFVRHKLMLAVAVCAVLIAMDEARSQESIAQQPPAEAGDSAANQVLVLRDGGVLVGEVRQEGDRYVVRRDTLQMQVRAANVLLIAESIEDAYQRRRDALGQGSTIAHLQLAEWCLRNDLIDQAEAELKMAAKLDPQNELVGLLKRRLVLARQRAERPEPTTTRTKNETSTKTDAQPIKSGIGELPDGAVELFTRRVQPVLVNNCTMAGCHEAGGEQPFQLDRALLHGLANRRSTMRNLSATLELVDREQPQLSRLITVPRQTHGGLDRPVFGPRHEAALRHLVDWVVMVTKSTAQEVSRDGIQTAAAEQTTPNAAAPVIAAAPQTLNTSDDSQSGHNVAEPAEFEMAQLHEQQIQFGAQLKRWQPRDEFDPEIFNRKYATATAIEPTNEEVSTAVPEESSGE